MIAANSSLRRVALLVEDSESDAELLREHLRADSPHKWEVEVVRTLVELRHRGTDADVIVLDLNLPDSTGLATFDAVRQAAPDTAIVIVSGTGDRRIASEAIRRGAQDYVIKGEARLAQLPFYLDWAVMRETRDAATGTFHRPEMLTRDEGVLVTSHLERLRPRLGLSLLLLVVEFRPPPGGAPLPTPSPNLVDAFGDVLCDSFRDGDVVAHLADLRYLVCLVNDVRAEPTGRLIAQLSAAVSAGRVPDARVVTGGVAPTLGDMGDVDRLLGLAQLLLGPV